MPDADTAKQESELKYQERLNISVATIAKVKEILKNDIKDTIIAWSKGRDVDKQCYHIIGPAGVGKTQICFQIADELTEEIFGAHNQKNEQDPKEFETMMIKAPVLSRDDFIIPFPVEDEKGFNGLCCSSWVGDWSRYCEVAIDWR